MISRARALQAGLSARQIRLRLEAGEWERVYPNVYRTAAMPVTPEQWVMAASLAAGEVSVASHQSAVWLWGLLERPPARAAVTLPYGVASRSRGFDQHHNGDLDWARVLVHRGIRCTDPLRSVVDFAGVADGLTLDEAIDRGLARGLVTLDGLEQEIARLSRRGRRGPAALRERLELRGFVGAPNPSVLESRTLRLLAACGIEVLGTEVVVGPEGEYRLDVLLTESVALEVDGYRWHSKPEHKARDEERRNHLRLAGVVLLVYCWADIVHGGANVALQVRRALDAHVRGPGRPSPTGP